MLCNLHAWRLLRPVLGSVTPDAWSRVGMIRKHLAWGAACAATALSLCTPSVATAQTKGFALDRFDPSERGSDWFVLDSLDFRGDKRVAAGLVLGYAYLPLAVYNSDGSLRSKIVQDSLVAHPGASVVLWDRLRAGFDLPVYAWQDGQSSTVGASTFKSPSENIGDLRLGVDARIYGTYGDVFTLAGGFGLYVPTGSRADFTGDGVTRFEPHLMAAGEYGQFVYAAKLGFDYRPLTDAFAGSGLGSDFLFAASGGLKIADGRFVVGPELYGSSVVTNGQAFSKYDTPFEALFGGHAIFEKDWRAGFGIGPGLTRAYGEPTLRLVASLEWAPAYAKPEPPPPPAPSPSSSPATSAAASSGPRRVTASSTAQDACPDRLAGPKTDDPATNGLPRSTPTRTASPTRSTPAPTPPGVKADDPKTNGCPPDTEQGRDPRPTGRLPERAGRPAQRRSEEERVSRWRCCVVGQRGQDPRPDQVPIQPARRLDPASGPDPRRGGDILGAHPDITHVRIEGHTDNVGQPAYNLSLSQRRAASVLKWLASHGVEKKRLASQGFGMTKPIDDNGTDDGRRNNRRVEFHIEEGPGSGKGTPKTDEKAAPKPDVKKDDKKK